MDHMLRDFTTEELKAELNNRKMPIPLEINPQDFYNKILKFCTTYMRDIIETGHGNEDIDHYLYEEVFILLFGKGIFKKMGEWEE